MLTVRINHGNSWQPSSVVSSQNAWTVCPKNVTALEILDCKVSCQWDNFYSRKYYDTNYEPGSRYVTFTSCRDIPFTCFRENVLTVHGLCWKYLWNDPTTVILMFPDSFKHIVRDGRVKHNIYFCGLLNLANNDEQIIAVNVNHCIAQDTFIWCALILLNFA